MKGKLLPKETKALKEGTNVPVSAEAYRYLLRRQGELQAAEGKKRNLQQIIDHVLFDRPETVSLPEMKRPTMRFTTDDSPPVEVEGKS